MFRKGKSAVEGDSKKSWSWVETEVGAELEERLGWRLAWWGSTEKEGGLTFARIERKTPVLRPALQLKQSSLYSLYRSTDQGEEDQMARSSA